MTTLQDAIDAGEALEREGSEQDAIAYFVDLLRQHPDNAEVAFAMGGAYDYAGFETEAIPHYRRAIELGLPAELHPRVAIQLGSSLRNVGEHTEAVAVLRAAAARFPDHVALRVFLALAQHSAGDATGALITALDVAQSNPDRLDGYQRAIGYYIDELRPKD
jgi:tetratricopeptide (TPR) repeat protein